MFTYPLRLSEEGKTGEIIYIQRNSHETLAEALNTI